jgi:beta-barrel assembly-enhancing protease
MPRFVILLSLAAASFAQQREPGRGVNFYSIEKETALGRQFADEFRRDHKPLASPAAQAFVEDLGQRLAAQIGGAPFTYTFATVADNTAYSEPIALPGGFVFVPSSILLAAKDENEFAGILAHSIAHIASRDGTRQATRAELVNIASVPLIYTGGWTGYAIREGYSITIPLAFLQQWRKFELDADRLAATKLGAAGYDPAALARYIDREQVRFDESVLETKFAQLPPRAVRVDAVQAVISGLPQQSYPPRPAFAEIQDEVRRLAGASETTKKPPTLVR